MKNLLLNATSLIATIGSIMAMHSAYANGSFLDAGICIVLAILCLSTGLAKTIR